MGAIPIVTDARVEKKTSQYNGEPHLVEKHDTKLSIPAMSTRKVLRIFARFKRPDGNPIHGFIAHVNRSDYNIVTYPGKLALE